MARDLKRLSKFLAVILRHNPDNFGIELDEQGYAPLDDVWAIIEATYDKQFDMTDLETVVVGDQRGKKRYEIIGEQIRAMYGHSKPKVIYPASKPPETLYHGTNKKAVEAIRREGLRSLGRQYVHMTTNYDNAVVVAKRRTQHPVMLVIQAQEAYRHGIIFHHAETEHYLAKAIPAQHINFPE